MTLPLQWILFGAIALVSWFIQYRLKSKFEKYSRVPISNGMTGREVAEKMLRDNGVYDVKVISTPGMLTDHYNPVNKTVNLSEGVYNSQSVAAAAVAAHECGHAVQHARAYLRCKCVLLWCPLFLSLPASCNGYYWQVSLCSTHFLLCC